MGDPGRKWNGFTTRQTIQANPFLHPFFHLHRKSKLFHRDLLCDRSSFPFSQLSTTTISLIVLRTRLNQAKLKTYYDIALHCIEFQYPISLDHFVSSIERDEGMRRSALLSGFSYGIVLISSLRMTLCDPDHMGKERNE